MISVKKDKEVPLEERIERIMAESPDLFEALATDDVTKIKED